jgi:hypothetical protein
MYCLLEFSVESAAYRRVLQFVMNEIAAKQMNTIIFDFNPKILASWF